MAIIYSYPKKTTPNAGDFLVITDSEQPAPKKNRTKSLTIGDLASYVITSQNAITGGGTLNTIAMFTPDGQKIGDSKITQQAIGAGVTVNTNFIVTDDATIQNNLLTDSFEVSNDSAFNGEAIFAGDIEVTGNATFESDITINGPLYDESGSAGAAGQVLSSTSQGVAWIAGDTNTTYDLTGAVSNVNDYKIVLTGSDGTIDNVNFEAGNGISLVDQGTNTVSIDAINNGTVTGTGINNTLPIWTDGPNGVLGDSIISELANEITIAGDLKVGQNNTTPGLYSMAVGENNIVSGDRSIGVGFNNTVTGSRCGGLGANNIVAGGQVWATGDGNDVGIDSFDVGGNIIASGFNNNVKSGNSCVIGSGNIVTNDSVVQSINTNFVLGSSNTLNEVANSIAIGSNNTVDNNEGYILGRSNATSANNTYAVGLNNTLSSDDDYAFGLNNTLSGSANIAMALGHNNMLSGSQSYAFGRNLEDGGEDNTVIIGRYNTAPTATGRIVFGTGFNDTTGRKNAIEIQAGNGAQSGLLFPALRLSTSYNNDAEAEAAGVEEGELYRSNNSVKINLNQNAQDARNNEGFAYLTPQLITASAGTSKNVIPNYNLVLLSWTGGNGVFTLRLPLASANTHRLIRITTDGTLNSGANDKIDITATGGETIDGNTSFQISKSYEGVAVWSTGTEWIVIQAKAH